MRFRKHIVLTVRVMAVVAITHATGHADKNTLFEESFAALGSREYRPTNPGLCYTNGFVLAATGGCVRITGSGTHVLRVPIFEMPTRLAVEPYGDRYGRLDRPFKPFNDYKPPVELWLSFLIRVDSIARGSMSYAGLGLRTGSSRALFVGKPPGTNAFCVRKDFIVRTTSVKLPVREPGDNEFHKAPGLKEFHDDAIPLVTGSTMLVVVAVRGGAGKHWVSWCVNPLLMDTPAEMQDAGCIDSFAFNTVEMLAGKGCSVTFDEIRIGKSWASVVPYVTDAESVDGESGDAINQSLVAASVQTTNVYMVPNEVRNSILIVKGARGSGTAFCARQGSNVYVFTALHLIAGNTAIRLVDLDGKILCPIALEGARDRDLIRIAVSNPPPTELCVVDAPTMGSPVVVCGNAGGVSVLRSVWGTVLGVGPEKIETDAPFIPGHSGSPMLLTNNGVVGVVSYLQRPNPDWMDTNTPFFVTRRFGNRIDTVHQWVPIEQGWFLREANALNAREELLENILSMLSAWSVNPFMGELPPPKTLPGSLRAWVLAHNSAVIDRKRQTQSGHPIQIAQLAEALQREMEQLSAILSREFTRAPYKWHLSFFDESWKDCEEMQRIIFLVLDHIKTFRPR